MMLDLNYSGVIQCATIRTLEWSAWERTTVASGVVHVAERDDTEPPRWTPAVFWTDAVPALPAKPRPTRRRSS